MPGVGLRKKNKWDGASQGPHCPLQEVLGTRAAFGWHLCELICFCDGLGGVCVDTLLWWACGGEVLTCFYDGLALCVCWHAFMMGLGCVCVDMLLWWVWGVCVLICFCDRFGVCVCVYAFMMGLVCVCVCVCVCVDMLLWWPWGGGVCLCVSLCVCV